jgi:hypothetical protein
MSDTESPMQVMCGSDDLPDPDGVYVTESYLNVLLSLAYPANGAHCSTCVCGQGTE